MTKKLTEMTITELLNHYKVDEHGNSTEETSNDIVIPQIKNPTHKNLAVQKNRKVFVAETISFICVLLSAVSGGVMLFVFKENLNNDIYVTLNLLFLCLIANVLTLAAIIIQFYVVNQTNRMLNWWLSFLCFILSISITLTILYEYFNLTVNA